MSEDINQTKDYTKRGDAIDMNREVKKKMNDDLDISEAESQQENEEDPE